MPERTFNILFLSRRNAARGLFAEAVVNKKGGGRFHAFSAGVEPDDDIDPVVLDILKLSSYETEELHPKHWKQFAGPNAVPLDFVFQLSDHDTTEKLPELPGKPASADWHYPDPQTLHGEEWERRKALGEILLALEKQFGVFSQLPVEALQEKSLRA
jgi:protein-tyrosine-phosphatase